ncbi:TauD/TfdA family dioxygenase [Pseudonocardia abyssalis]|uniref:TauD/TfdA family dioxygenase n=1 Tax=Pseudonocardia abyssalis TaxID=2792008 RepID=A0ABS6UN36_9PSEU|nr:TauD/TfdA family dioxygenase [Pseudonocardia abyssalis]MBW0117364.1 TauD/TfdA family dioxygenase [Pseudonocardia abyssalis]MBW0133607.1 TauD/TfdA family dioxygenase [Pseudonocardia abyssalis]
MATTDEQGRRRGTVRPELKELLAPLGVTPARVDDADARAVLDRDGAVILPGRGSDPEELVTVAARLLGGRLRELFGIRLQHGVDSPALTLHSDGATVTVDVHGRAVRLRDPDEDYLFMLCTRPAQRGGDSVLIDGYALVDVLRETRPDLHEFLTTCDVDFFGGWTVRPHSVPLTPLVRGLVEHTRRGRRAVRASDYALPVPREPRWDAHLAHLDEYADVLATAQECAARFRLEAGELLVLDNYRFVHGRDAFAGERTMHVMTVRSTGAF